MNQGVALMLLNYSISNSKCSEPLQAFVHTAIKVENTALDETVGC